MGETESPTLQEKKIIRQVEYYFGDVNLPRDKFLKEKQGEEEGWITLECLTTFNRLKELTTDLKEICTALEKSKSGLLEINSEDLKVRRSKDKPLPDLDDPLYQKKKKMKTLYMKNFPLTYTMDQLSDFLLGLDVNTVFIKLRKDDEMKFKGSIFVELSTQEEADKLLKAEDLKCEEETLVVMTREDYFQKKSEERKGSSENGAKRPDAPKLEMKPGAVMHLDGLAPESRREDLKELFGPIEDIAWVDYNTNETQGFIRFEEEGAAQRAIDGVKEKNDGKIIVKEVEVNVRILEGEEEENFWKMAEEEKKKRNKNKFGGRGGGRGRRGGGRGRSEGRHFKRKRPWENGPKDTEVKSEPKGEHVRFDNAETSAGEQKPAVAAGATEAKKVKSEE